MELEKQFNRRMAKRDKLIAVTAKKFIALYEADDKIFELMNEKTGVIDMPYITEFLDEVAKEIVAQLQ